MSAQETRTRSAVRSASYNNELVVELLIELAPFIYRDDLLARLWAAAEMLLEDAAALERAWARLSGVCALPCELRQP